MTPDAVPGDSLVPEEIREAVKRLFSAATSARYGPYAMVDDGKVVVRGLLYRFRALDAQRQPLALQVFTGSGELAGRIWEQEVRTLLRLSAQAHPAVARVVGGGHDLGTRLSWVATETAGETMAGKGMLEGLRGEPEECVRQLNLLADGLALLHGQGVLHRNIQPATIDVGWPDGLEKSPRLRLTRFEMSGALSNLLRSGPDPLERAEAVRQQFLAQGVRSLVYAAPERLRHLLSRQELFEGENSDVFSLGMVAYEWFVEPLDVDELLRSGAEGSDPLDSLLDFHDQVRSKLRASRLPSPLRDILLGMIAERSRFTSAQVVHRVTQVYDSLMTLWDAQETRAKPLLVVFMPKDAEPTIYRWQWAVHRPDTEIGRLELRHLHESDLRGATLVHSPAGARPYAGGGDPKGMSEAEWALIGRRATWFGTLFRPRAGYRGGELGEHVDEALLIKYVVRRHEAADLLEQPFRRRIAAVDAIPFETALDAHAFAALRSRRPSWRPLLDAVRSEPSLTPAQATHRAAVEWLLDLQEVELRGREYPYKRDPGTPVGGEWVRLRYDRDRDDARIRGHRTGLFAALAGNRPLFAEFLESDDALAEGRLELRPDREGRPDGGRDRCEAIDVRRLGNDDDLVEVRVSSSNPRPIPQRGWIRPIGDGPAHQNLRRQVEASAELRLSKDLVEQFEKPWAIRGYARRWTGAGKGLAGDAGTVVQEILLSQPFFAVHGPPGTGKTTVVAHAVEAFMRAEPGARLLISAQANDALDHLATTVQERLRAGGLPDVMSVRLGGERSEEPSDEIVSLRLAEQTQRLQRGIKASLQQQLAHGRERASVRDLMERWLEAVEGSGLELQDRVRRGAGIVYATCSGASRRSLVGAGGFGAFDWVIVEEAAKAWPTELAIPLVRGIRWTLIGDHRQLPAYRREEIERTLGWLAGAPTEDLRRHAEEASGYGRVFDPLGTLFSDGARMFPEQPLAALTLQFRMRKPIADLVSDAFYDGELETHESTERPTGLRAPRQLVEPALVWLDTGGRTDCFDEPRWRNDGEAQILARLIEALEPYPEPNRDGFSAEPLAILTPWRAQRTALRRFLPAGAQGLVHTVDSFQGREADIVIASLVRDRDRGSTSQSRLGHATRPERVNVMLSRARRLLVLVGSFEHFHGSGVGFWEKICASVVESGVVIPVDEVV